MGIIWKYHMKMCHRGWWQNHTSAHTTLHIICTMWALNTATSHTCPCDEETVETVWPKGTKYKWASAMRAKACECVYNIKNAVFGVLISWKRRANDNSLFVTQNTICPALATFTRLAELMWSGLCFLLLPLLALHSLCRVYYPGSI